MYTDLTSDDIHAFQKGRDKAFTFVYNSLKANLYRYCLKQVKKEDAEDITAEVFFALWKNRKKMKSRKHIINFVYLTATHRVIDLKKEKRSSDLVLDADMMALLLKDKHYIKEDEQLARLVMSEVQQMADKLPDQCRRVFKYLLADMPIAEIAKVMNITPAAVYEQRSVAIKKLPEFHLSV